MYKNEILQCEHWLKFNKCKKVVMLAIKTGENPSLCLESSGSVHKAMHKECLSPLY